MNDKQLNNLYNYALVVKYEWPDYTCLQLVDRHLMLTQDITIRPQIKTWTQLTEKQALIKAKKQYGSLEAAYNSILDSAGLYKVNSNFRQGDIIITDCKVWVKDTKEELDLTGDRATMGIAFSDEYILLITKSGCILAELQGMNYTAYRKE